MGQDKDSLLGETGQGETSNAKAIIYHQQSNAQPVPEQWLLWKKFPCRSFNADHCLTW